jgi:hypothetical protein
VEGSAGSPQFNPGAETRGGASPTAVQTACALAHNASQDWWIGGERGVSGFTGSSGGRIEKHAKPTACTMLDWSAG